MNKRSVLYTKLFPRVNIKCVLGVKSVNIEYYMVATVFGLTLTLTRSNPFTVGAGANIHLGQSHLNEPRHQKTCPRGFRPGKTQTSLLSYRDKLEP